jgi:hypothetical protein
MAGWWIPPRRRRSLYEAYNPRHKPSTGKTLLLLLISIVVGLLLLALYEAYNLVTY